MSYSMVCVYYSLFMEVVQNVVKQKTSTFRCNKQYES